MDTETLEFVENDQIISLDTPSIIKVIGVGGGGGNAVNHMYKEGIHDVTFVVCNTDNQALAKSPVPIKLQLGRKITEGLGAGGRPQKAQQAAEESAEDLEQMLSDNTKMVFITAGMGGGTGTGAAPVIAKIAKAQGILTVGIVTIPFAFEGKRKILQALDGVEEMSKHVDALLVVNNERLRNVYPDLSMKNAFGKADDTLTIAAKSIAEIITVEGHINCDFADVNTIMKDGGVAIMSAGYGEGTGRITKAIEDALNSPLLNNNNVYEAKRVLLYLSGSDQEDYMIKMEEMAEIDEFMNRFDEDVEVIWGAAYDNTLTEKVKITLLATGFNLDSLSEIETMRREKEVQLQRYDDEKAEHDIGRINTAYGQDVTRSVLRKSESDPVMLDLDQMVKTEILDLMDAYPTYNRDQKILSEIKALKKTIDFVYKQAQEED